MFQLFGVSFEVYIIILVIAIPLFFFWRWILRKCKVTRSSLYSVVVSLIMSPFVYFLLVYGYFMISAYYPDRTFDRDAWLNDREIRYEYTQSLRKQQLLDGKTQEEVKEYLGEPDEKTATTFTYYIGFKPSVFKIDPDCLVIEFENNKVSEIAERNS